MTNVKWISILHRLRLKHGLNRPEMTYVAEYLIGPHASIDNLTDAEAQRVSDELAVNSSETIQNRIRLYLSKGVTP